MSIFTDMIKWNAVRFKSIKEPEEIKGHPYFDISLTEKVNPYDDEERQDCPDGWVQVGSFVPKISGVFSIRVQCTETYPGHSTGSLFLEVRKKDGTVSASGTVEYDKGAINNSYNKYMELNANAFTEYEVYAKINKDKLNYISWLRVNMLGVSGFLDLSDMFFKVEGAKK